MEESTSRSALLQEQLDRRILVLDGGMSTLLQSHQLSEQDFSGS